MKQKTRRSEQLPKYGTTIRTVLVSEVADLPGYQEGLSKGFPLFTKEELDAFKELYKDGLTWEDIDRELSRKGIFFKKATFRKYIQEGNISKAINYKKTQKGRVAIFPADTISHINFIQYYYKVIDGNYLDIIIALFKEKQITYLDMIESNLSFNIYASIYDYICLDDGEVSEVIKETLKSRPDDRDKFLKMLDDIDNKFNNIIGKDIDKFVSLLKKKTMSVSETGDYGKEVQDE
jgi:hypothetical protein